MLGCCLAILASDSSAAQSSGDPGSNAAATSNVSQPGEPATEFMEIVYKGKTYRVPIGPGGAASDFMVGSEKWRLNLLSSESSASEPTAAAASTPRSPAVPQSPTPSWWTLERIVLISSALTAPALVLIYFLLIEPMRRRRPLKEAIAILAQDRREEFVRAEELLNQSLLAGLRRRDVATARFALGCVRALLGKHEEASTVLGELEKSGATIDRRMAYLMLWVQSRLKNHERVERIYTQYEKLLVDYRQTPLIVSITMLAVARLRWARREINGAMHYFEQVRKLKVLADEIPSHLDDHEVVMGTISLFEKNTEEATKHFNASVKAAAEREKPTHPGRLGLLLCEWRKEGGASIDEPLEAVLVEMQPADAETTSENLETRCPHCGKTYSVNVETEAKKVQCRGCRRRFTVERVAAETKEGDKEPQESAEPKEERLLSEEQLLLRNVRLWSCMARVGLWLTRKECSGLPTSERAILRTRLDAVIRIDAELGDPYLIGGLIDYYFADDDRQRKLGREQLELAVGRDVHLPEVQQLLDREHKLDSLSEHSLTYFHQLSRSYAEDPEVDPELRGRFVQSMNRRSKFSKLGSLEERSTSAAAPSLENLQGRGRILQTRISNIVRYRLSDAESDQKTQIGQRLDEFHERTKTLAESAKALEKSEFGLMESTGEFLFGDETPLEDSPPAEPPAAELPTASNQVADPSSHQESSDGV